MKKTYSMIILLMTFTSIFFIYSIPIYGATATSPVTAISINGNADFATQAKTNGWPGNGSSGNPYVISNIDLTTTGQYLISIQNTNDYFILSNNHLNNGVAGIYLYNVQHGTILNNSMVNNEKYGIILNDVQNTNITGNTVSNNGIGIFLTYSQQNTLMLNNAMNNTAKGFFLAQGANNNTLLNNTAINNGNNKDSGTGFYLTFCENNYLAYNKAINNTLYGIFQDNSANNNLNSNIQYGNGKILQGESRSQILLFIGIIIILVLVVTFLKMLEKFLSVL